MKRRNHNPIPCALGLLLLLSSIYVAAQNPAAKLPDAARAILSRECFACHGEVQTSGLDLRERDGILKGGKRGPAVLPGKADDSLLYQAVAHSATLKMPPGKDRLPAQDLQTLRSWINETEFWKAKIVKSIFTEEQRSFWSFQPIQDPNPPQVKSADWVKSPIDRFILAELERKGLSAAPAADKRTLIRRVTYDLTGLPPTPEEIDAFLADDSPDAFSRLTDRLLGSKQYGEKWGRFWLDVGRYADTTSSEGSFIMRYAYRYRDYVVRAFNDDKPYNEFIIEQLAGDLLPATNDLDLAAQRVMATGFLMIGEKGLIADDKRKLVMDIVDEQIDVTGRAFLGLTVACARCHDHKFDPIPTRDYYSMAGIFRGVNVLAPQDPKSNISMWNETRLMEIPGEEPIYAMIPQEAGPVNLKVHVRGSLDNLGEEAPRGVLRIVAGENNPSITSSQSGRLELAKWIATPSNPLTARVMVNRIWQGYFGAGLVASSDNFGSIGDRPSHPELLDWLASRFLESGWSVKAVHRLILSSSAYQMRSTSDRSNATNVDPDNHLLWHMNRRRLTAEEVRDSILAVSGRLDRAIGGTTFDWQNKAGYTDPARGLYSASDIKPGTQFDAFTSMRRSIYLPVIRTKLPAFSQLFDCADPNTVTTRRGQSTAAPQSLFLMNNPLVREAALEFAKQLLTGISTNPLFAKIYRLGLSEPTDEDRLRLAHVVAVGRPPTPDESEQAVEYLDSYQQSRQAAGLASDEARLLAWQSYCQTLFMMNEFLYVN